MSGERKTEMYCRYCGSQLRSTDKICPSCGAYVEERDRAAGREHAENRDSNYYGRYETAGGNGAAGGSTGADGYGTAGPRQTYRNDTGYTYNTGYDSGSAGWGILGCCFPIVGLILFLVWRDTKPKSAKSAGIGALAAVIIYAVLMLLSTILGLGTSMYYFGVKIPFLEEMGINI